MFRKLIAFTRVDPFILAILCSVAIASVFPAHGQGTQVFDWLTDLAIALLFFLYGARLSPQTALQGLKHWRLHLTVLAATFILFPIIGLGAQFLVPTVLSQALYVGVIYVCALPSTVQSSIAFTSIARGNVAAAICAASASNLLGIIITPLLVGLLLGAHGVHISGAALRDIVIQLLLPFVLGQLARPWIGAWVVRNKKVLGPVDRCSILLVVYTAFSEGVVSGIWHRLSIEDLVALIGVNAVLLALVIVITTFGARKLGFNKEDEIVIVFCGSKKSLASGLPMASVLFPASAIGLAVLPLMLFHQMQLMLCAYLARRYAARPEEAKLPETETTAPARA